MEPVEWVQVPFLRIVHATENGLLVRLDDKEEVWLPRSHVLDGEDYEAGEGPGIISVTEWIARTKRIEV